MAASPGLVWGGQITQSRLCLWTPRESEWDSGSKQKVQAAYHHERAGKTNNSHMSLTKERLWAWVYGPPKRRLIVFPYLQWLNPSLHVLLGAHNGTRAQAVVVLCIHKPRISVSDLRCFHLHLAENWQEDCHLGSNFFNGKLILIYGVAKI